MEETAGALILYAAALFDIAGTVFGAWQIWRYFDARWGNTAANIATALSVIPLFWGGCLLFVPLWVAWWLTKRTWHLAAGHRERRNAMPDGGE